MTDTIEEKPGGKFPLALVLWLVAAGAAIVAIYWAASAGLLTWEEAVEMRGAAQQFVADNMLLAYAVYIALFVVMAVVLFPAQLWIIVFGAILFGFWPALIVSWAATVMSAVVVFLLARGVLAGQYRAKASKYLARVEQGFKRDQFTWMLAVRFIPVVPYCISNVAPAFLGARLPPFVAAAAVGVVPYVTAYTFAGAKAAGVLDANAPPDVASMAAEMAPVMLAIAALPLLALFVRRLRRKKPA
ncbi:MAG: VTT domain-containing protein [Hyphomonadaceae bacterium]|nr:VTT domain-containing protein [Hyphomonadaceae bacterium]